MTLIQNRRSKTSGSAPSSVADGELVLNQADGLLFYADAGGAVRSTPLQGNAPLASPAFTGAPTAPTPAAGDSSTRLATTGFVTANFATAAPLVDGTASAGSAATAARSDHVHPTDTTRAKAGVNGDITALTATLTSTVFSSGLTGLGQMVAVCGNYGAGLRNDGSNVYLLQTASGSATGGYNSFRPFAWNLSNGSVVVDASGAGCSFGGAVAVGGGVNVTGNLTAASITSQNNYYLKSNYPALYLDTIGVQQERNIWGRSNSIARWRILLGDGAKENGGNSGSDFYITNFDDSGNGLQNVLSINRANGVANFSQRPNWAGSSPWDTGNFNPADKVSGDHVTSIGFNNGNVNRPYFFGNNNYRDMVYSCENYNAIGSAFGTRPYFLAEDGSTRQYMQKTDGAHEQIQTWNGSNLIWQVDSTSFTIATTSDARLKIVEGQISQAEAVKLAAAFNPIAYAYDSAKKSITPGEAGRRFGFLAQDLETLIPGAVIDGVPDVDGQAYKILSQDAAIQLCAVLSRFCQDLAARIERLEGKA